MSDGPWAEAYAAAQRHLLAHFATSPLARSGTGEVSWVVTEVASNAHNGVVRTRLDPESAPAAIASMIERFGSQRLPATWFLDPGRTPADVGVLLEAAGCRPERSGWVMGGQLDALPGSPGHRSDGVIVEEVTTPGQLEDWFQAARGVAFDDANEDDVTSSDRCRLLYAGLGLGTGRPWRHWLASDHGRPVGTASAFFDETVLALEHVGVVPAYRRRGLGSDLTLAPLAAARDAGLRWAVLGPSPDGQPVYESLGFQLAPALTDHEYYLPMRS